MGDIIFNSKEHRTTSGQVVQKSNDGRDMKGGER